MSMRGGRLLTQLSHGLTGRHRTEAHRLDIQWTPPADSDSAALAGPAALIYGSRGPVPGPRQVGGSVAAVCFVVARFSAGDPDSLAWRCPKPAMRVAAMSPSPTRYWARARSTWCTRPAPSLTWS